MRRHLILLVAVAMLLAGAGTAHAAPPGSGSATAVTACVSWEGSHDSGGECVVHGQYPGSFVDQATVRHCEYTDAAGVKQTDGNYYFKEGVVITATGWISGLLQMFDGFVELLPAMIDAAQQGKPFDQVYRVFTEFCHTTDDAGRIGVITVLIRDVFFDPEGKWAEPLEASIDYRPWPVLQTMPDPATSGFKALVVNAPAYLAVNPAAWHAEKANDVGDRGWTLTYVATPVRLSFTVDGRRIDCVTTPTPKGTATMFPPLPAGFTDVKFRDPADGADPRPCTWVPRRPGTYPVTISITYRRSFIAEGFVAPQPDRTFTFTENVNVVELKVVNVKPDGA